MVGPAFSRSHVSGIRCWLGSSRNAPGARGQGVNGREDRRDGRTPVGRPLLTGAAREGYRVVARRLASPACRNSEVGFHLGGSGALAISTADLTVTRSCCIAPS